LLRGAALAALACVVALALLWLYRNPLLAAWDELGHINISLADAARLREGNTGALRDGLFLWNRWLPPGLRLVGLPVAAAFWPVAPEALRLTGLVCFLLTVAVLWLALRPLAGRAGAAAGVLLFALAPINIVGAQNFMTEAPLHLMAALALWLLAREAPGGAAVWRNALLGLVFGLGALTKLTFLPTLGPVWLGVALHGWWRDRNRADLVLRLLLPLAGLLLLAWPHYAINGPRYLAYARATAEGFGYVQWPEHGMAFLARAARELVGAIFGPGGVLVLLAGLLLLVPAWRWAERTPRVMVALCLVAALPGLVAYLGSRNQTDRYLGLCVLVLSLPVAVALGWATRWAAQGAARAGALALLGLAGGAGLAQAVVAGVIAFTGPVRQWPLEGLSSAAWRDNEACDFAALPAMVPAQGHMAAAAARIGVFGQSQAVNQTTVAFPFRRLGRPVQSFDIGFLDGEAIDWPAALALAASQDLLVSPVNFRNAAEDLRNFPVNRFRAEFFERLSAAYPVQDSGEIAMGGSPACAVHVFAVRPEARRPAPPRNPEVNPIE
jgi:hypothetical protein